jgi:exosortase/archaeosortase family protein
MSSQKQSQIASVPAPFFFGLALAGCFMAFAAWDQSYWWRMREDYSFGWLVPLFIAYLIYDRWPRVVAQTHGADSRPDDWIDGDGWSTRLAPLAAYFSLIGGGVLFLSGAFYKTAAGTTHMSTVAITLGMTGTVLATIYFLAPTEGSSPGCRSADRRKMVGLFFFPTAVWLLSAPMLAVVENNLNLFLMQKVTSVVFFVFDRLGLPLEQRGNVLVLPSGSVGVAEACSGIRSLTGCLFAGSFLAAVFLQSRWKQAALVVASLLFAFLANLLRSIFLTSWAYGFGAKTIEGAIHDVSGYAVLGLTVVALLCLLPVLDRGRKAGQAKREIGKA